MHAIETAVSHEITFNVNITISKSTENDDNVVLHVKLSTPPGGSEGQTDFSNPPLTSRKISLGSLLTLFPKEKEEMKFGPIWKILYEKLQLRNEHIDVFATVCNSNLFKSIKSESVLKGLHRRQNQLNKQRNGTEMSANRLNKRCTSYTRFILKNFRPHAECGVNSIPHRFIFTFHCFILYIFFISHTHTPCF